MNTAADVLKTAIIPALGLLPKHLDTPQARVLLMAIGLQESRFKHRHQIVVGGGKGPARGYWQFERGTSASKGGVWGVFLHRASNELLRLLCRDRDCNFDPMPIWERIETDDVLAAGVARLLLLTDPAPLPAANDTQAGWDYYARVWKPGKPHPKTWPELHGQARSVISEEASQTAFPGLSNPTAPSTHIS